MKSVDRKVVNRSQEQYNKGVLYDDMLRPLPIKFTAARVQATLYVELGKLAANLFVSCRWE